MLYSAFESAILLGAAVSSGHSTHLTWWAVVVLAIHDIITVLPLDPSFQARVWANALALSLLVQTTVVLMSLMGCSMIQEALLEVGPWAYYFGNFVLHYWPTLRLIGSRPQDVPFKHLHFDAARILAIYSMIFWPDQVYGCDSVPRLLVLPLGVLAASLFEYSVLQAMHRKSVPLRDTLVLVFYGQQ